MRTPLQNLACGLLVTLSTILVAGGIFEVTLRCLEPAPLVDEGRLVRKSSNPQKGYELIPGATGIRASVPVSVNSFGCRDREYPSRKPVGAIRIVGVGDSLTFGFGVREEDTYLARLERKLQARGLPVEVINCGVYGYNVDEEAALFGEVLETLKPDLVIIGYELGDILRNSRPGQGVSIGRRQRGGVRSLIENRFLTKWLKESYTVTFLSYRLSFLLKKLKLRTWDETYGDANPLWQNLRAQYERMALSAHPANVAVIVAIIPELANLDSRYPWRSVHARVAELCRRVGFKPFDLLPAFLGENGAALWIHPRDRHPNPRAHQIMADALLEEVAASVNQELRRRPPR